MKTQVAFLTIGMLLLSLQNYSQIQVGSDLLGEKEDDQAGHSVAISKNGNIVAMASLRNDDNGENSGSVRVFEWNSGKWQQMGRDIDGENTGDMSGYSLSMSHDGQRLAIGARRNSDNGTFAGHVRVFEWQNDNWNQLGEDIDGNGSEHEAGHDVSISGDGQVLAVGALLGGTFSRGSVRLFELDNGSWQQMGQTLEGSSIGDELGSSVALSQNGQTVALGARRADVNGENSGLAKVYDWQNGTWTQIGQDIPGANESDMFGSDIATSEDGSRIVIASRFNSDNGEDAGHVRVFERQNGSWQQVGMDIQGAMSDDRAGWSVDISGDGNLVAVGAIGVGVNGVFSGQVQMMEWKENSWKSYGTPVNGVSEGDNCGWAVALSNDGQRMAVSALRYDGTSNNVGHVRVYDIDEISSTKARQYQDLKIWPNPSSDVIYLPRTMETIQIFDAEGTMIMEKENVGIIDIQTLKESYYVVHAQKGDSPFLGRFIKE